MARSPSAARESAIREGGRGGDAAAQSEDPMLAHLSERARLRLLETAAELSAQSKERSSALEAPPTFEGSPSEAADQLRLLAALVFSADKARGCLLYEEAARANPSDESGWRTLARAARAAGNTRLALSALDHLAETGDDDDARACAMREKGDLLRLRGEKASAMEAYRRAAALSRGLVEKEPQDMRMKRALSLSLERIGDVFRADGATLAARMAYVESLDLLRMAIEQEGAGAMARRKLAAALERLGDVCREAGDPRAARMAYGESLELTRALAFQGGWTRQARREISLFLNKLGDVARDEGDDAAARKAYAESFELLFQRDSQKIEAQGRAAVSQRKGPKIA